MERDLPDHEMRRAAWIAAEIEVGAAKYKRDGLESRIPGFDAEKQLVDVSGEHEFVSALPRVDDEYVLMRCRKLLVLMTFVVLVLA